MCVVTTLNVTAKGGNGGDGIAGGGGGMGAGGAIYAPQSFLNGSNPSITLINVSINNCSAVGGNGGNYLASTGSGGYGGGGGGGAGTGAYDTSYSVEGGSGGLGGGGGGGGVNQSGQTPSGGGNSLGGGGGGGSGLGGAIFVDSSLNFTLQAFSGIPTTFSTSNNTIQFGTHGTGGLGSSDGLDGSACNVRSGRSHR